MTAGHTVLVTGVNGYVGVHMARHLLSHGCQVVGIARNPSCGIQHDRFRYICADLTDFAQVQRLLEMFSFTHVVHLAGASDVQLSYERPLHTLSVNAWGTLHLLEAIRVANPPALRCILAAGTAYEYELRPGPLQESDPLAPLSPYAWSKHMMTALMQMYGSVYGLATRVARTFNLIGPGNGSGVCSKLSREVALIEQGLQPAQLIVGNIEVKRDFLDVRDAVSAYEQLLLADAVQPGTVFNVCSGSSRPLRDIIELLRRYSKVPFDLIVDRSRLRANDVPELCGDNGRLRSLTGWKPAISLEQSVLDTLNEYRNAAGIKEE